MAFRDAFHLSSTTLASMVLARARHEDALNQDANDLFSRLFIKSIDQMGNDLIGEKIWNILVEKECFEAHQVRQMIRYINAGWFEAAS
jgi:hypothetical protein